MFDPSRRASARLRAVARAGAAAALSLALNAGGLAALAASGALSFLARGEAAPVRLAALPAAEWEANRRLAEAEPAPARPPPPVARPAPEPSAARPEPVPSGRIVDVAPSRDPRRPEQARFLAERDGRVERETRSRYTGLRRWDTPAPRPTAGEEGRQGVAEAGEDGEGDESAPGAEGAEASAPRTASATATQTATSSAGSTAISAARAFLARGEGGLRRAGTYDPRLLPVGARFDAPAGGGPSDSVPPTVAEGEETRLNTRRFRFAEFYARVQASIRREWDPNRAWDARDPHDRILGRRTRNATFDIHLEPDGRVREIHLVGSSGVGFLDRECERAIRAAAPFPNPPASLVEGGEVVLRGWVLSFDFTPRGALGPLAR
jgi:TonB family protein